MHAFEPSFYGQQAWLILGCLLPLMWESAAVLGAASHVQGASPLSVMSGEGAEPFMQGVCLKTLKACSAVSMSSVELSGDLEWKWKGSFMICKLK